MNFHAVKSRHFVAFVASHYVKAFSYTLCSLEFAWKDTARSIKRTQKLVTANKTRYMHLKPHINQWSSEKIRNNFLTRSVRIQL